MGVDLRARVRRLESVGYLRVATTILIGLVAGILSGLLGIGGGVVLVPLMVYLLGMRQHTAHGTSLAAISVIVLFSAVFYSLNGQMDWTVAGELALGGVIGAYIGAKLSNKLSGRRLRSYFGLFLIATAFRMLYDASKLVQAHGMAASSGLHLQVLSVTGFSSIFLVGLAAGVLSGLFGVGGGIIMVPSMVLLLGFSQKLAQGISLAVIVPVSISGAVVHSRHGNVRPGVAVLLAIGGILGGFIGSHIAVNQAEWVLKALFGILMLIMGGLMIRYKRPQST